MLTNTLYLRTILEIISLLLLTYLVIKKRRASFLLLELQSFLIVLVRFFDLSDFSNPYRDLMLTATGFTMLFYAVSQIFDDNKYKQLVKRCIEMVKVIADDKAQREEERVASQEH